MAKAPTTADRIAALQRNIRAYRIRHGDFCAAAGLNASTWCRWRNGKISPRATSLDHAEAALSELVKAVRAGRV